MKVYLDDLRRLPDGWEPAYTANEAIVLLRTGIVTEISLDHDLGDSKLCGEGYDVLLWIEEQVAKHGIVPPMMHVHTSNIPARDRMLLAIQSINATYQVLISRN